MRLQVLVHVAVHVDVLVQRTAARVCPSRTESGARRRRCTRIPNTAPPRNPPRMAHIRSDVLGSVEVAIDGCSALWIVANLQSANLFCFVEQVVVCAPLFCGSEPTDTALHS